MKNKPLRACLLAGLSLVAGLAVHAQGEPRKVESTDDRNAIEEPETIVLSPFVVQDDKDIGYQASSTLAGTRLNSDIGDLGAPVSVVTKEFLEDTGVSDINEIFLYTVSTEGSGLQGNYSATVGDAASGNASQDDSRRRPQASTRVRGLGPADLTRDYFLTDIPLDSYNIDRVDISRGPNAILFGLGSPAGVANSSLIKANYNKNATRVSLRYGQHDSYRGVLDTNYILVPKKLAVRAAILGKETHWVQNPTFEREKRFYGTFKASPFKDTILNVSYETGEIAARRPLTVAPEDRITAWFLAGKPIWNASEPWTASGAGAAANPTFPPAGVTDPIYDNPNGLFANPNIFWQLIIPHEITGDDPAYAGFQGKRPPAASNPNTGQNARLLDMMGVKNLDAFSSTLANQGLAPSVFNFRDQLFGGETGRSAYDFDAVNASLEHSFFDHQLGFEVAYDNESYQDFFSEPFGQRRTNAVFVDVNSHLLDGRENPNFGRPFILSWDSGDRSEKIERESSRATVYGVFDAAKHFDGWGRWLGRHTLTGFASQQSASSFQQRTKLGWVGDDVAFNVNETSLVQQRRNVVDMFYFGPSLFSYDSLDNVDLTFNITARPTQAGDVREIVYYDRYTAAFRSGEFTATEGVFDAFKQKQDITSQAVVLQSYWLKDNLVTTVGWRQDESIVHATTDFPRYATGDLTGSVDLGRLQLDPTPVSEVEGKIWTYSAVLKMPKQIKLPFDIRPSVHYTQSENFQPVSGQVNVLGDKIDPPTGETKEYGLSFTALDGRVNFRANFYETALVNARSSDITSGNFTTVLNMDFQTAALWYESMGNGSTEVTQANIDRLVNSIPQKVRDLVGYRVVSDTNGNPAAQYTIPTTILSDVTNFEARGFELEATVNLTKNWRMLFNVAKQQTRQSNTAPYITAYVAERAPIWNELGDIRRNPGGTSNETLRTIANRSVVGGVVETLRANDGVYSPELRKWRANFVTNYNFTRDSWLKGVGIGGAYRWQDKAALAYPRITRPDGIVVPDVQNPFYTPAESQVDLWISYRRPLFDGQIGWKVQLNVGDIFAKNDYIPLALNRDGTVARYRIAPQRTWSVTSTFDF